MVKKDFKTPKKKQKKIVIGDKDVEEHFAYERKRYESFDTTKVKKIRLNPLIRDQISVPDWAMLSFAKISNKKHVR